MGTIQLRLLGSSAVVKDGRRAPPFKIRKTMALLAFLATSPGAHPRSQLAGLLWSDCSEKKALDHLRFVLWDLRQTLGASIVQADRVSVTFERDANVVIDLDEFQRALRAAGARRAAETPETVAALERAADLYRGDLLSEFELPEDLLIYEWLQRERARLREMAVDALYRLAAFHTAQRHLPAAIAANRRLLAMDPWREEAHRQMMLLLARSDQRSAALAQYEMCRRVLAKELGVAPTPETTALYERIRAARSASAPRHNLPAQFTPFIGREDELAKIEARLDDPACRLLTLVGPGGVGKTRLALQAASARINDFLHGVFFVPLASISSPEFLVPAIADALTFSFSGKTDPKAQLLAYLREKEMLLVMDNFEHLLPSAHAGGALLVEILQSAPQIKIQVTSRERLNLQAEWLLDIEGLEGESAERMFVSNAQKVKADFSMEAEKSAVSRICQLVERMPLGIELAAVWVREFACSEIAREIARNLNFLATSMQDVPARHRSLRAVFDHSWRLLSEEERRGFSRLSVFRGGFRAEAVEAVNSNQSLLTTVHWLIALADKSLLRRSREGRYEMHELLRQYAEEKLAALPQEMRQAHDLHCKYYAEFLRQREKHLKGSKQKEALAEIGEEIDNVRAGWSWAVDLGKTEEIGKALESLSLFYERRSWLPEGEATFRRAAERLQAKPERMEDPPESRGVILGDVLARQGAFCIELGLFAQAREVLQASLSIFRRLGVRREMAFPLLQRGSVAFNLGEYAEARQYHQESLLISRESGDPFGVARALLYLSTVAWQVGEYLEARQLLLESLTLCREMGDQFLLARVLNNLGNVAYFLKEYAEAKQIYQESLALRTALDDRVGIGACLSNLGGVAVALGERQPARQYFQQALKVMVETNLAYAVPHILAEIAELLAQEGKKEQAAGVFALVAYHPASQKATRDKAQQLLAELESQLAPDVIATAMEKGKALKLEEVAGELLSESERRRTE